MQQISKKIRNAKVIPHAKAITDYNGHATANMIWLSQVVDLILHMPLKNISDQIRAPESNRHLQHL